MNSLRRQNSKNEKEGRKRRSTNKLYSRDCKKMVGSFKNKILSPLKTNTTENYSKPTCAKKCIKVKKSRKI